MNPKRRYNSRTLRFSSRHTIRLCFISLLLICSNAFAGTAHYPLRSFFPTVQTLSTATFLTLSDTAVIVDIRSEFEFDVIRINSAKHISVASVGFIQKLEKYRPETGDTPLIFYGNDSSSSNTFQAALLAQNAGFRHISVYDSGVFSLLMSHPDKVTLMASSPASPRHVISQEYYQKTRIDLIEFSKRAGEQDAVIIDIRDLYDREYSLALNNIRNIPMDSFLQAINNRIWAEKQLLIFDANGEKTTRLQFFLQANGYANYAFLRGGMAQFDPEEVKKTRTPNGTISIQQAAFLQLFQNSKLTLRDLKLFNVLISSIHFENNILIPQDQLLALLACDPGQLMESIKRLEKGGYILRSQDRESFFFKIDPQLAWKGEMTGLSWRKRCAEFRMARGN